MAIEERCEIRRVRVQELLADHARMLERPTRNLADQNHPDPAMQSVPPPLQARQNELRRTMRRLNRSLSAFRPEVMNVCPADRLCWTR